MDLTALTVGGFTQPSVARSLIEQQGSANKGVCQRFLWIFPEPVFSKFSNLEPVSEEFTESLVSLLIDLHKCCNKSEIQEWAIPPECKEFEAKYDEIQDQLKELCGKDDLVTGILSKTKGQILRVAAILNALFSIDPAHKLETVLSNESIIAAINFVEVCGEHAALIAGKRGILGAADEPSTPTGKSEEETAAFCLSLPGSVLDLTQLLNAKKFRSRGNKDGALKAMRLLAGENLGKLEKCRGKGSNKQYIFRKRPLPDDDDDEGKSELAFKLMKFNVSLQSYSNSFEEIDRTISDSNIQTTPQQQ